jgi:hypothetical protein
MGALMIPLVIDNTDTMRTAEGKHRIALTDRPAELEEWKILALDFQQRQIRIRILTPEPSGKLLIRLAVRVENHSNFGGATYHMAIGHDVTIRGQNHPAAF